MSYPIQHASLVIRVFDLLHLDHLRLFQDFNGVKPVVVLRLHQMDATEAAGPQRALESEVIESVLPLGGARIRPNNLRLMLLLAMISSRGLGTILLRRVYDILDAGDIGVVLGLLARVGVGRGLILRDGVLH